MLRGRSPPFPRSGVSLPHGGYSPVMNRRQRRATEKDAEVDAKQVEQQRRKLIEDGTPQDVTSVRAKSQRRGKMTADKWNQ